MTTRKISTEARRITIRMNRTEPGKRVYFNCLGDVADIRDPEAEAPHPINWTYAVDSTSERMTQRRAQEIVSETNKRVYGALLGL